MISCSTVRIFRQTSLKTSNVFLNSIRKHYNYQYKPGLWPRTKEQEMAAAQYYEMCPEEYRPHPESDMYGDYPKLPDIGADSKDWHYPYDYPELKRNFNEPWHVLSEIYGEDRYDISAERRFSVPYMLLCFLSCVGLNFAAFFYLENYKVVGDPVLEKQYPWNGPHYEFC